MRRIPSLYILRHVKEVLSSLCYEEINNKLKVYIKQYICSRKVISSSIQHVIFM